MVLQKAFHLIVALAVSAAWALWVYAVCRNLTDRPAAFRWRGWAYAVDRREQPAAFALHLLLALLVIATSGYFAALFVYYEADLILGR
jgi:hypothetical protein